MPQPWSAARSRSSWSDARRSPCGTSRSASAARSRVISRVDRAARSRVIAVVHAADALREGWGCERARWSEGAAAEFIGRRATDRARGRRLVKRRTNRSHAAGGACRRHPPAAFTCAPAERPCSLVGRTGIESPREVSRFRQSYPQSYPHGCGPSRAARRAQPVRQADVGGGWRQTFRFGRFTLTRHFPPLLRRLRTWRVPGTLSAPFRRCTRRAGRGRRRCCGLRQHGAAARRAQPRNPACGWRQVSVSSLWTMRSTARLHSPAGSSGRVVPPSRRRSSPAR